MSALVVDGLLLAIFMVQPSQQTGLADFKEAELHQLGHERIELVCIAAEMI